MGLCVGRSRRDRVLSLYVGLGLFIVNTNISETGKPAAVSRGKNSFSDGLCTNNTMPFELSNTINFAQGQTFLPRGGNIDVELLNIS
jgi:hypothetical protein